MASVGGRISHDNRRVAVELIVFVIIWAILVLGVFMDVRQKLFGRRRTLIIGASIIAGAILVASDKVTF